MKHYFKECKNTKQVNSFLKRIGLGDFEFDIDYDFPEEFDFDSWINTDETKGVSIQVTRGYEVFVTKYSRKDIEELEPA
jgi:hypothetical protein